MFSASCSIRNSILIHDAFGPVGTSKPAPLPRILTHWYAQVSAMSMARDVTDSSPAQPQSSSSRLANETAASCGSGPGRGPSRRNSRRALTERALAEGAARTRSKGVRARESRMSLASNSGTASPPVMSPGLRVCVCVCVCAGTTAGLALSFVSAVKSSARLLH